MEAEIANKHAKLNTRSAKFIFRILLISSILSLVFFGNPLLIFTDPFFWSTFMAFGLIASLFILKIDKQTRLPYGILIIVLDALHKLSLVQQADAKYQAEKMETGINYPLQGIEVAMGSLLSIVEISVLIIVFIVLHKKVK